MMGDNLVLIGQALIFPTLILFRILKLFFTHSSFFILPIILDGGIWPNLAHLHLTEQ